MLLTLLPHLFWKQPLIASLIATKTKPQDDVEVRDEYYGDLLLRVHTPKWQSSGGALLWFHGGGHLAGRPDQLDSTASKFASRLGVVVVVPRYRLAPKHPFPADLDDAYQAWLWLKVSAKNIGVDPQRMALVGNSAGGGLAAALAQRIHDGGGIQPCAQVLFYPMLDDRTAADSELDSENQFLWNNRANRVAWNAYLAPNRCGDEALPDYAAPARRSDLSGLPPAWIGVGSIDLFYRETVDYAQRLQQAGVSTKLRVVDAAPHVFEVLAPDEEVSRQFVESAYEFLASSLAKRQEDSTQAQLSV